MRIMYVPHQFYIHIVRILFRMLYSCCSPDQGIVVNFRVISYLCVIFLIVSGVEELYDLWSTRSGNNLYASYLFVVFGVEELYDLWSTRSGHNLYSLYF